jgi:acetate kinase
VTEAILVLNAGSSSIKFALFSLAGGDEGLARVYRGEIDGIGAQPRFRVTDAAGHAMLDEVIAAGTGGSLDHEGALALLLEWIDGRAAAVTLAAAGHRVVHGGRQFSEPALIDASVVEQLGARVPLAPLHQPHNLAGIRALARIKPNLTRHT